MPRGKYVNHKGRSRHFTSPEELQQESEKSSDEEQSGTEGEETSASSLKKKTSVDGDNDGSEIDSEEDNRESRKGVAGLIEIENPNRTVKKTSQRVAKLSLDDGEPKPQLSRREREQVEKQKARLRYEKLHAAGKTNEAKSDLARLAIIRQERAEAAAKREAEKKAQDAKRINTAEHSS